MYAHDLTILGDIALCILAAIGLHFIRKDYMRPNDKEIAEIAIGVSYISEQQKKNG